MLTDERNSLDEMVKTDGQELGGSGGRGGIGKAQGVSKKYAASQPQSPMIERSEVRHAISSSRDDQQTCWVRR